MTKLAYAGELVLNSYKKNSSSGSVVRALRYERRSLWVQFPGNTHTDKTKIHSLNALYVTLDKSIC